MTEELSSRTRAKNLEAMAARPVDVLVIGGGIVGAWTALVAAMRGDRTALVEKGDFASGTSGKTSRLVHGGLRYLQQFRVGLVRQAARERDLLLRTAPDLVKPLTFLLPVFRGRGLRAWQLRIGLWLYDALSRDKVLPTRKWLSHEDALALEPRLSREGLVCAATYADAITRDARLVLSVVRKAAESGAFVANYCRVTTLLREGGRVVGATVRDVETGLEQTVLALTVVNATGVWVDELQNPTWKLKIRPTKGIHVLVPRERIGHNHAIVLPARGGRIIFVLPWGELSLIGTTDTEYRGDRDSVAAETGDVNYLLDAVNAGFPSARLTREDVVSSYAGLRPLIDTGEVKESDISRGHEIVIDPDGLVSVAGGKLTTARAMAEETLNRVRGRTVRPEREMRSILLSEAGVPDPTVDLGRAVAFSVKHEMALHLDDFLMRRTGLFHELRDHGQRLAPAVVEAMAVELGWDAERRASELSRFREVLATAVLPEGPYGR